MKELINIPKGFQTSINIAYDLNDENKIRNFIPTMSALEVIEDVLLSTVPTSTQRSRIIIGAYGKGKSHIILVLLSLLSKKGNDLDRTLFKTLFDRMKSFNQDLYEFAKEYLKSNNKILPVIIRGSSTSLTQSFLNAIQQTLNEEGFSDLMPETHFQAAVNQIYKWREEYPSTYQLLLGMLSRPISDFILALNEYDVYAYDEFVNIYPTLTAGSIFNPFLGFDIVDIYEKITIKLKEKGYSGIYIVYDEFSKYLESSITSTSNSDIKFLQDFAEKCNRSNNTQMHLMLISHKDIANYIDSNLPKDKVDGWRGVSGRFKHVNLHNNYSQIYEVISSVIEKEPNLWKKFVSENLPRFSELEKRFINRDLLDMNIPNEIMTTIKGCYPLHPVSIFILPRLSEKIAQNERTLFTFLSAEEKYTLTNFVSLHKGFELLTPDYIYDYFEPLFRKEPYTSTVHNMYKLTNNVLRKLENKPLHAKIIKTLTLIYLVEQFEKLPPVINTIIDTYTYSVESTKEIDLAIKDLIENDYVVYLKKSNGYLKIKETSGINIQDELQKYKIKNLYTKTITNLLNNSIFDSFMYPTAYNDMNDIIRYFEFIFIDSKEYWQTSDWETKISESEADGVVFAILPENDIEIEKIKLSILNNRAPHNRAIFIVPKKWTDISQDILDYSAVSYLKNEALNNGDDVLYDEYDIYYEDLSDVIESFISTYTKPENNGAYYYYNAKQYNIVRKSQLSALLSDICKTIYYRTPVIRNESINKNDLPSTARNSRTKILTGLLENELAPNIGLTGTGQDVSIMRSTLIKTEVLENIDTNPTIQLHTKDKNMNEFLDQIRIFFTEDAAKDKGATFNLLYERLTSHNNGFGIKRGVLPIYIAVILHLYKNNIVILYGKNEVKITPELLNDINESPDAYSAILEDWSEEKSLYMAQLEEIFSEYVSEREKSYNQFTYLFLAMNRWYLSLSKYAKESIYVYGSNGERDIKHKDKQKFLSSLKQPDINPREFLFEKLFEIFGYKDFNINIVDNIKVTKKEYEASIENLMSYLIYEVRNQFNTNETNGTLTSIIKDWHESLNEKTKQYLFSGNENSILKLMETITNDEKSFIQRFAKAITYLRIEDWNDNTVKEFIHDVRNFKENVEDYDTQKAINEHNSIAYEITITDTKGNRSPKYFDRIEYSEKAILLKNEISTALEEMGRAITEQEKRQVLIELLERFC